VSVSYLEIYNEKLRDLLDPTDKQLTIYSTKNTGVNIKNLSISYSDSYNDIVNLLADGKKLRVVAATNMNKSSSRSHAVFTLHYLEKSMKDGKKQVIRSKLNIVDLAGSERQASTGATGQRLKEGSTINKSLTYLGVVIQQLGENCKGANNFVPYRNSQLTHLLSESLGGNSKTIMIAALSPAAFNYEETLSTLRFAQNVSVISTKTTANIDEEAASLQKMRDEISEIKAAIEKIKSGKAPDDEEALDDESTEEDDDKITELEEAMKIMMQKMAGFKRSESDMKQDREEMDKKRQEALLKIGLSSSVGKQFNVDDDAITLVNISDDPSISNCLVYVMKSGKNSVGSEPTNTVILKGLGVAEKHAIITNSNGTKVFVEPQDAENSKIQVNGKQIFEKTQLNHLDRLIFGHGNSFKVVIGSDPNKGLVQQEATDYSSILQDRLSNDTPEAKNMRKYLEEMRERIGEKKAMQFVRTFQQALDELDEANEYSKARYTAFPLDKNNVFFTIEVMIDIKDYEEDDPEVAIRCRHKRTNQVLYLWR
jgi:hypothetical protein